jgi:hypothetical protein
LLPTHNEPIRFARVRTYISSQDATATLAVARQPVTSYAAPHPSPDPRTPCPASGGIPCLT